MSYILTGEYTSDERCSSRGEHLFYFQKEENEMELSPEAKRARNEYFRKWREANKDKVKELRRKHWEKKAQQMAENQSTDERNDQQ